MTHQSSTPAPSIPGFLKDQKKRTASTIHLAVGLGLLAGFLLIIQAYYLAQIINTVVFEKATLTDIFPWLWPMLLIFVIRALLAWASEQVAFKAAATIKRHLRKQLHQHLQKLGPAYLTGERSGEMVNTLVDGVEALEDYYAKYLPAMSLVVLIPLSILIFVFPMDWVSGLIMLGTAPLIPFFMILIGKGTEKLNKKQWRKLARMSAHLLDMIQGLTTLKIFNASRQEADLIARVSDDYRRSTMSVLRVAFLSSLVLEFLATVSIAMVAVLIGFRLFYGEMDFLYGFFVLLLAPEFYLPLRNMGTHYHARLEAIGAAEKMLDILDTPTQLEASEPVGSTHFKSTTIQFNEVTYSYYSTSTDADPDTPLPAVNQLSFTINKGERLALVGASGSGKTTITRLLLGFIQPQQGEITVDDSPVNDLNLAHWRNQLAWMPQSPHIFHGSIRDNISLGDQAVTAEQITTAAQLANADEFIRELANGYDTIIGEQGQGLSGGQIQRLALARVFLKDAPVVILDEATANLDANSERLIQQSLDRLSDDKTVIVVAHRLNTVIHADRILVLDKGHIVEQGTHNELLEKQGVYGELVTFFQPPVETLHATSLHSSA